MELFLEKYPINLFIGRNGILTIGNGKTLSMVREAYLLKFNKGFYVISNFKTNFSDEIFNISDLIKILERESFSDRDVLILIDEISVLINAYQGKTKINDIIRGLSRQIRKRKLCLFMTAQVYNDIPPYLRRLAINIIIVEKFHRDGTICLFPDNKNCPNKNHLYLLTDQLNRTKPFIPDKIEMITKGKNKGKYEREKDFFYKIYDSSEIIFME